MKSLLNALKEGRLIELPESDKEKALEYLAHIIEAVPDISGGLEVTEAMLARERTHNTALGLGVACPHARTSGSGDLVSAVGWSPTGIDYGAPDGKKVHLVVMYFIPDAQKNTYLKEISALAGAVHKEGGISTIAAAEDVSGVRERLLDWVSAAVDARLPEAKARMIRLEARQAVVEAAPSGPAASALVQLVEVRIVILEDGRRVVLCGNPELVKALETEEGLGPLLAQQGQFERGGFRLVFRGASSYAAGRTAQDYLAVRFG